MDSWPKPTGQVAALLEVPEHKVTNQIRLGKVTPPLVLGRRAWSPADVLKVACILGRDSIEIRNACAAPATKGGRS